MNNIVNVQNDKPSLHWSKKYYDKVIKMVNKNSRRNYSSRERKKQLVCSYYEISWMDFLPSFIGWCHALFSLSVTYGIIRSTAIFNKELYKYYRNRFLLCILFHFIFGPILIFLIIFLTPLIDVPKDILFSSWNSLFKNLNQESFSNFAEVVIKPYFVGKGWWISIILLTILPSINFCTFFNMIFVGKINDKYMKIIFLENELKMKTSNFTKKQ